MGKEKKEGQVTYVQGKEGRKKGRKEGRNEGMKGVNEAMIYTYMSNEEPRDTEVYS